MAAGTVRDGLRITMNGKRNLFTSLHRWAGRQDENFTTEALVNILDLLLVCEPQIGLSVLQKLSCGVLDLKEASSVQITTQPRTAEGVPDVEISAPDQLVYIEAKVYSDLGENQLESYRRALADSGLPRTGLVLLTHYPPTGSISQDVYAIRWHQIAEWLEVELDQSITDPICRYLTAEFLGFLSERGLSIIPVRSPISGAIRTYQKRTGQIPGQERRIRSLEILAAEPDLRPLTSLLAAMGQALNVLQLSRKPSLDSGKGEGGGWIGFNINSMEYFFCILLTATLFEWQSARLNEQLWT